ncbi:RICIN domain-containing protein [Amycolatopsis suaedae]|uniref:XRE family transcriptional regulator n=1 Tax=Amycolatopsis suaedae TaxID=2510978 RepID=A0A4Q7J648_9PSEU|nr:RICIN domain-containing protein [Amycolatopsis suaedae]RZQ62222.1 XRE family transcriptional regulator [Amycolatopsis suaedae]
MRTDDDLATVRDATGFVAAMQDLRLRSGYTLRQLEGRAAACGDVLPRSTVADIPRRQTLPRPELVAAFVRACGEQDRLGEWMAAYRRAARPAEPDRLPAARAITTVLVLAACAALGATLVVTAGAGPEKPRSAAPVLAVASAGTWARIRPVPAPRLCLSAGIERTGRYRSEVAVQRPCGEPGPRTLLQPAGDELTSIRWEHPVDATLGCLTVLDDGPAANLVEPRDECRLGGSQLFRLEHAGADAYRVRRAGTEHCLGVHDGETVPGAEIVQQPCGDHSHQRFHIDINPATR